MTDQHARFREAVVALASADSARRRFGAKTHGYALSPPVTAAELAAIEERIGALLPDDYRDFIRDCSAGGAGPYYGLLPATRIAHHVLDRRTLPLAHLGCGYLAVLVLDGPASGQMWLDARHIDISMPMFPSFTTFVLDWVDRLAHSRWLEGFVPAGRCALQAAISGYLGICEQQMGVPEGQLAGAQLREALAGLGPGAIAIAAEGPLFGEREYVDPCVVCARVVENLVGAGLDPAVVAPGVPPIPARS